jgi:excisionase family DNA binding protein
MIDKALTTKFLTTDDLMQLINVPRTFVYEHTRKGSLDPLPAYRFGKHLRFKSEEIQKWIEDHRKS